MIPVNPYFWSKSADHDVTLTSFVAELWYPGLKSIARMISLSQDIARKRERVCENSSFINTTYLYLYLLLPKHRHHNLNRPSSPLLPYPCHVLHRAGLGAGVGRSADPPSGTNKWPRPAVGRRQQAGSGEVSRGPPVLGDAPVFLCCDWTRAVISSNDELHTTLPTDRDYPALPVYPRRNAPVTGHNHSRPLHLRPAPTGKHGGASGGLPSIL